MDNLVIQTAARNFLMKLMVLVLGMIGSALVTRGLATEDQVHQALDPLAQVLAGILLSGAAVAAAWVRSVLKRQKEQNLLVAKPADVTVKGSASSLTPALAGQADGAGPAA